ncbi:MAG TPA: hypothetical protein VL652_32395, partial [Kutzneria sp.]|nr:hypothetical protein [Kutzneria sp.]
ITASVSADGTWSAIGRCSWALLEMTGMGVDKAGSPVSRAEHPAAKGIAAATTAAAISVILN